MTKQPKTPPCTPRAAPKAASATPLTPAVSPGNAGFHSGYGLRKRPATNSLEHVHPKQRQASASGVQGHAASLESSINQSEATKAEGCLRSPAAKSPLGQANPSSALQPQSAGVEDHAASSDSSISQSEATKVEGCLKSPATKIPSGQADPSPAIQPQSGLTTKVNTETEADVSSNSSVLQTSTDEGTITSPSKQKELSATEGSVPICSIDVNFLQKVVDTLEEIKANQEGSRGLAKESISINQSLEPTFQAILKKYGDVTKGCSLESSEVLTSVLEVICEVVEELQKKRLNEIDCKRLNSYYLVVRDAEKMELNVDWLRTRLDEIKDAVKTIVETKKLNDEKNKRVERMECDKKDLELTKVELEQLKSEVEIKESQVNFDKSVIEQLSSLINGRALRIQQLQNMTLMEPFQ